MEEVEEGEGESPFLCRWSEIKREVEAAGRKGGVEEAMMGIEEQMWAEEAAGREAAAGGLTEDQG